MKNYQNEQNNELAIDDNFHVLTSKQQLRRSEGFKENPRDIKQILVLYSVNTKGLLIPLILV